jgi:23S rRNA (cytosine1962-C5)-methyltransferase
MDITNNWEDYELLATSNKYKLERWHDIYLLRPDPAVIWDNGNLEELYKDKINAIYHRSNKGGGSWENIKTTPSNWIISYKNLKFNVKEMGFKHTGLFPEQAFNWDYISNKIKSSKKDISVLNLFAYTGAASIVALQAGASVVHVDSSRGMVDWCKENVKLNNLEKANIRYIVDDVIKFVQREIRRGHKYDAIIMDPPSYGRGVNNEVWDIESSLFYLVNLCKDLLTEEPLFFLINSYTAGLSPKSLENILKLTMPKGLITCNEIGLKDNNGLILPCGIYGRWESEH